MAKGPVMSKGDKSNQSAQTPQWFYNAVDSFWRPGIDLAASKENTKCAKFYTEEDNSLIKPWHRVTSLDEPGWCNHPYKNCPWWIEKAHDEAIWGATVIQLQPAALHRNYYLKWAKGNCATVILNCAMQFEGYGLASSIVHALFIWNKGLIGNGMLLEADPRKVEELHKVFAEIKRNCI